jgi:tRNA-splicing ligase RtcB
MSMVYNVPHDLANFEEYNVECRVRNLCVHRKGATRAFGPGAHRRAGPLSEGIAVAVSQPKLPAEEAPYAYKHVSQVVKGCEGAGSSKIVARLRPVGVVKG